MVLVGDPEGKRHCEDLEVGRRIILRWILEKLERVVWAGFIIGLVTGCCETGNEPSGSIKLREILEQLSDECLIKKYSALWSWLFYSINAP
jgi:hypothetical protein